MGIGTQDWLIRLWAWGLVAVAGLWSLSCGAGKLPSADGSTDVRFVEDASADKAQSAPLDCFEMIDTGGCCGAEPGPLQVVDPGNPCVFAIPIPPANPSNVGVYLNKTLVPKSPTDGWQYGPTTATLVFTGSYCDLLTAAPSDNKVLFLCGCPGPPPIICVP